MAGKRGLSRRITQALSSLEAHPPNDEDPKQSPCRAQSELIEGLGAIRRAQIVNCHIQTVKEARERHAFGLNACKRRKFVKAWQDSKTTAKATATETTGRDWRSKFIFTALA